MQCSFFLSLVSALCSLVIFVLLIFLNVQDCEIPSIVLFTGVCQVIWFNAMTVLYCFCCTVCLLRCVRLQQVFPFLGLLVSLFFSGSVYISNLSTTCESIYFDESDITQTWNSIFFAQGALTLLCIINLFQYFSVQQNASKRGYYSEVS
jgi:hypothetical protein